jgi:hypothetical protein
VGCATVTSGGAWQNVAFSAQSGTFTAEFDATPSAAPIDNVIGLSRGAQTAYAGFAALARFSPTGNIDARNGGAYAASSAIPYSANVTYHFRLVVNAPARNYSIFVRPAGGAERIVGTNFAFRTEQNTVTSLDWWGTFVNTSPSGSATVCNFTITGETEPPPLRTFRVSTISALQSQINSAIAGDLIILTNGVYTTTGAITINKQGTVQHPIVISADTIGGAEIRGSASFIVSSPAAFVTIRGFRLTHAIGTVQAQAGTSHCRFTRNVFQLTGEGRYLLVSGDDCEVDHNTFQNKSTAGQMFSIHGPGSSGMAQRTWVHHNLFQNFTSIGANGGDLGGPAPNARFEGNIVFGSATNGDMPSSGARRVNPLLSRDSFGVFRLLSTSPAINTSVGSYPEVTIDLDGQTRSGTKDVGADEFSTATVNRRPLTTANVGPNAP